MARGVKTCPTGQITTLVEGGTVYQGVRKMSNVLIKNTGGAAVYLQWTEEPDTLTASNGWDLGGGETIALEFNREGQRYAPDILILNASGSSIDIRYVVE